MLGSPTRREAVVALAGATASAAWRVRERRHARRRRGLELELGEAKVLADEQAQLHHIAALVAGGASADAVCSAVAMAANTLFNAQVGFVARLSEDGSGELRGRSMTSPVSGYPEVGEHLHFASDSAVGRAMATGQTVRVMEGAPSRFADSLGERMAAPIILADGLWGTVAVAAPPGGGFADDLARQLERFAGLVALAIGNAEARDRLIAQATTDSLTGLANRRAFGDRLDQEIGRAHRHRRSLSIAMFDVDRFKAVNDTLGHLAGDEVLIEVSARLRASVRAEATLARIGGDEFAAILPESTRDQAAAMAQRACDAVRAAPFPGALRVTLSAGVSELAGDGSSGSLRLSADTALYSAKRTGRDRVYSDAPEMNTHREPHG